MTTGSEELTAALAHAAGPLAVLSLRINFRIVHSTRTLPEYIGSTFHGALGWAAASASAQWRELLFPMQSGLLTRDTPNPFVLAVDGFDEATQRIAMRWTLLGPAAQEFSLILRTLSHMAEQGLGTHRIPLHIESIEQRLPNDQWHPLIAPGQAMQTPVPVSLADVLGPARDVGAWTLDMASPLVLVHEGKTLSQVPSPGILAARALARLQMLLTEMTGHRGMDPDLRHAIANNVGGHTLLDQTQTFVLDRYARAEGRRRRFEGITGQAHLVGTGKLAAPIWQLINWIQLGKKTSYGFGVVNALALETP